MAGSAKKAKTAKTARGGGGKIGKKKRKAGAKKPGAPGTPQAKAASGSETLKKSPGRPRLDGDVEQVSFKIPRSWIRLADDFAKTGSSIGVSRAGVLRAAIEKGLPVLTGRPLSVG